jgi:hypothetical protein
MRSDICKNQGCNNKPFRRGMCDRCYRKTLTKSSCQKCDAPVHALGFCLSHYRDHRNMKNKTETCGNRNCDNHVYRTGLCHSCYEITLNRSECKVEGCIEKAKGRGYCMKHYQQLFRYGYERPTL